MEAISFILSGKTAHFKKPDVNSYVYFTYNNIHKPALCGLLGAILGLGGYTQLFNEVDSITKEISQKTGMKKNELKEKLKQKETEFPEYYKKLSNLKISIKPLSQNGYFSKKVQVFNNSVGYASKEQGGNLIVREQWLENPRWQILLLDDDSIERDLFDKLKDYLINSKTEFLPYLGKNDHPAKIEDAKIIEMDQLNGDFSGKLSSIFLDDEFTLASFRKRLFWHKEFLPISLKEKFQIYNVEQFVLTNATANSNTNQIYSYNDENYYFF